MTLKSFPRGGRKPQTKSSAGSVFPKKPKTKPRSHRTKSNKQDNQLPDEVNSFIPTSAACLTYVTLSQGMVVLGRVREAREYDLTVSLPGRLVGRLQLTDISASYTKLLKNIIGSEDVHPDDYKNLPELYRPGDYLVCYVKELHPQEKWRVTLSLEPELVNQNLDPTQLAKGSKFVCVISSVEEHGYVVDTGITNLRAFLAAKDVDEGKQYFVGQQLFCVVKETKATEQAMIIKVSAKAKHIANVVAHDDRALDALVPGTKLMLNVTNILSDGLQISFNKSSVGYINQIYLDNPLVSYAKGMDLTGTLLYVLPTVKFAYFSLPSEETESETLSVGDILTNARVLCRERGGILMSFPKGLRGFVPLRRTEVDFEKVPTTFAPNSRHKCRVLSYDWFDRVYICTMQRELLEQEHFTPTSFAPGELLDAEISKIDLEYGSVTLTVGRSSGYVPPEHVSDTGSNCIGKLKVGQSIKARVLTNDHQRNRVLFTLKQSLINSSLPILCDVEDAQLGSKHHGTIVHIANNGLLVQFFGGLKGWTPPNLLGCDVKDIKQKFSIGMVVSATIVSVARAENRLTVSLVDGASRLEKKFCIGETVEGTVIESSAEGVQLKISENEDGSIETGFLPSPHMAPSSEVASLLAARCVPGDKMSAVVFSTSPHLVLTSTFVTDEKYTKFENLKVGDNILCSVKEISPKGLKVLLPLTNYKKFGHVPSKEVTDLDSLQINQLLFGKITSIHKDTQKITLSTALHKLWKDAVEENSVMATAVDVLSLYMNKVHELSQHDHLAGKPISKARLGQRVKGTVQKVTEHGLVLSLNEHLLGTVRKDSYTGTLKPGDRVSGTILWVNYVHEIVEVSLKPAVVSLVSINQSALPKLPLGSQLRGEIVLVTNWFVMVVLKGQGRGMLAALPAKRHLNDVQTDLTPYAIGLKVKCYVVLNSGESDILPICILKSSFETPKFTEQKALKRKKKSSEDDVASKRSKVSESCAGKIELKQATADNESETAKHRNKIEKQNKISEKNHRTHASGSKEEDANVISIRTQKNAKALQSNKEEEDANVISIRTQKNAKALQSNKEEEEPETSVDIIKKTRKNSRALQSNKEEEDPETSVDIIKKTRNNSRALQNNKEEEDPETSGDIIKKTRKNSRALQSNKEEEDPETSVDIIKKTRKNSRASQSNKATIPECGFYWDTTPSLENTASLEPSSDSDEETDSNPKQKRIKLSAAERREQERQAEREIREREETLASNQTPNSVDQFDRLVLSSPDSSVVWIQYMVFHLQATEFEKARAVARRAIKTINFREEEEKLNVWQAWLNLESRFGTPESLGEVFQEAVKSNDALKVYAHMLTVHAEAGRQPELERMVTSITGKFKQNPQVWVDSGAALLKMGLKEKARYTMQRALQSLPAHQHVDLMVRFAQLENRHGDTERAQTLFEQVLGSYPKRVDVWSSYVDALVKSNDIEIARKVLERATAQTLPPRKMKTLFKKFISFEEQHGTPENIDNIKQMAVNYVQNQCNKGTA